MTALNFVQLLVMVCYTQFSWGQKVQNDKDTPTESQKTLQYTHQLVPSELLVFDIDSKTNINNYFYDAFTFNDVEYLGLINRNNNALQVYSIPEKKLYTTIKFNQTGSDAFPQLRAFTFVSPDSILMISLYGENLWMVDIKGNVKKKFSIQSIKGPLFNMGIIFYSGIKPIFRKNKLYLQSESKQDFEADTKLEVEINLVNESWEYVDVRYPAFYHGNFWRYDICRDAGKNSNIIYSFAADPHVQEYDFVNWKATPHLAKSDYVENVNPLLKSEDEAKYLVETPHYTNFIYDRYRDVYYRFVRHRLSAINSETGEKNGLEDASFSIIILDASFNKIGETKVEDLKYQINSYFVAKAGLYISNAHPKNSDSRKDRLAFTLFKLQKKNSQ